MTPAEKVEGGLWSLLDEIAANGTVELERHDIEWLQDGTRLAEKWPLVIAELRTTLVWLKDRMPCASGKCCDDIRTRVAAIEALLTDEVVSK